MKRHRTAITFFILAVCICSMAFASNQMKGSHRPPSQNHNLNQNMNDIDIDNRSNSQSNSGANAGIYNGGTIYPAIPQRPDHSKERYPFGAPFDWNIYWHSLLIR